MKKIFLAVATLWLLLFTAVPIHAQAVATDICNDITDDGLRQACTSCLADGTSVWSAVGCIRAGDPKGFISQLLGWSVAVGGGIAFLMIMFAGIQISTAAGDPKRVKAGQELLTSAIAGLLLIIFSIILLNFIGFSILGLPGFGA